MFFPLSDDDRALVRPAYVTWVLLLANVAVFVYQMGHPDFTYGYAAIPAEITGGVDLVEPTLIPIDAFHAQELPQAPGPTPIYLTLLTAMFMHGGFAHIAGNMLFLWIFGDNVEHRFGHLKFLLFYLGSGLVASFAQIAISPDSVIPTLGASGAISGVLGAYLVLFPHNRVIAIIFIYVVSVPAYLVIVMWAFTQFINGAGQIAQTAETGGVAYAAHIGGFVTGVAMALFCRRKMRTEPDSFFYRAYQREPRGGRYW